MASVTLPDILSSILTKLWTSNLQLIKSGFSCQLQDKELKQHYNIILDVTFFVQW